MTNDLFASIVCILNQHGNAVGTGFVVTDEGLIATCAHVVEGAGAGPGETIEIILRINNEKRRAFIQPERWRAPNDEDIAILHLEGILPAEVQIAMLGSSGGTTGHRFKSYGFPNAGDIEGLWGYGRLGGYTTIAGHTVLQLSEATEVTGGFSGGPVLDQVTRRVVGMVTATADPDERWRLSQTAFITPAETLREVCPDLKLSDICPYRGLEPFTEAQAEFFFGRKALIADLENQLKRYPRFLAVVGPSGSGKSSLVRAGLLAPLRRVKQVKLLAFRPDSNPFASLATISLKTSDTGDLRAPIRCLLKADSNTRRVIFFADQFEELFTLCPEGIRQGFVDNLLTLLESDLPVTVIFTLRADFYGHLLRYSGLIDWLKDGQVNIPPMGPKELRAAVEGPARRVGLCFEEGLVEAITAEAARIDHSLPLLQSALTQLWQDRVDGLLTHAAYQQIGQVTGAIGRWAEDTYSPLNAKEKRLVQHIFTRLVYYGEAEGADTRQRRMLAELVPRPEEQEIIHRLVNHLADARLLVTDGDLTGTGTAEIIHDALLWEWKRLRRWRTEQREFYLWRQRLDERYKEWEDKKQDEGALLRGATLTEAEKWLAEQGNHLSLPKQDFIQRSVDLREREEQEEEEQRQRELRAAQYLAKSQRRRAEAERRRAEEQTQAASKLRRRAFYLGAALLIAILALISTLFFANEAQKAAEAEVIARQTAEAERNVSRSRELAALAISNLTIDPELSILLAMEAVTPTYTTEAEDALRRAIQASRAELTLAGHKTAVNSVAYSPNGMRLATAGDDGVVRVWDTVSGQVVLTWSGHFSPVRSITFNQNGALLATGSDDQMAKLWDTGSGRPVLTLTGHTGPINSLAFSPDGKRLATASGDHTAKVWNITADPDQESLPLVGHTGEVNGVAFSPDGTRVATVSSDMQARVWDATTGEVLLILTGHTQRINGVAFSPCLNSKTPTDMCDVYLATGSRDKTVKIWDVQSGDQSLLSTFVDPSTVYSVIFSPDGKHLATASADRTAKVWDVTTGERLLTLAGHREPVYEVAFSFVDQGLHLATASTDKTAKVWNLGNDKETLSGHTSWANRVVFSPDDRYLVSTSLDKTARVWDVASRQTVKILDSHDDVVAAVAFNPSGTRLATTSFDGTIKIWDTVSWTEVHTISVGDRVGDVAYNHDGTRLAATSFDNQVRIWDTVSWEVLTLLDLAEVYSVAFSPDGNLVVAGGRDQAKIWETESGRLIRTLPVQTGPIFQLAFNPAIETQLVTTSGDGRTTAKVWDITTGELLYTLVGHTAQVNSLAFNRKGTRLATGSSDKTVKIWDVTVGPDQTPLTLPEHAGQVPGVAFSQNEKYLAASVEDGTVRLHILDLDDLLAKAGERLTRGWRIEECQVYLHQEQCPPTP